MDPVVTAAAQALWDYHRLGQPVAPVDVILGLGSYDPRVAEHAAALWHEGVAPWLVFTGGVVQPPERMRTRWQGVEAEVFRHIALERGVPPERVLVETRSTNTGENFRFTEALLRERGLAAPRVLVVCKPFMERRSVATGRCQSAWPEIAATSPPETMEAFWRRHQDAAMVISDMVGDLQRLHAYPRQGFSAPQEIPLAVWEAFRLLVDRGYTGRLIPGEAL